MTLETLRIFKTGLNQIQNILNLAKPELYHKIALVDKNRIQQSRKVLRTSGVIERNPIIKIFLQTKVGENRTLISIKSLLRRFRSFIQINFKATYAKRSTTQH